MPLAYPLAWDVIRWAKRIGARSFDFGGITLGTHGDDEDRLGGISDFKRYFTTERARVGQEWILEPHPLKAAVAHAMTSGYALLSGLRR
jgi:lipid II:glycine glycyltransferase (peptidoglycan interpeptide bridge formation enzyme)